MDRLDGSSVLSRVRRCCDIYRACKVLIEAGVEIQRDALHRDMRRDADRREAFMAARCEHCGLRDRCVERLGLAAGRHACGFHDCRAKILGLRARCGREMQHDVQLGKRRLLERQGRRTREVLCAEVEQRIAAEIRSPPNALHTVDLRCSEKVLCRKIQHNGRVRPRRHDDIEAHLAVVACYVPHLRRFLFRVLRLALGQGEGDFNA